MTLRPLRNALFAVAAGCMGMAGQIAPAHAGVFSATRAVIAIMDDELFIGEAEGHLDGTGTIAIRSQRNPVLACLGAFTSDEKRGGSGGKKFSTAGTELTLIDR